jgi:hypothetical protein
MLQYTKPEIISLRGHPDFTEAWLSQRIQEDPTILGLGDVELLGTELRQPGAGRLDLLLRDPDTRKRYEVEIMLGGLDESHVIRTIEYWDIERKRYPQYDHCAVIVAENITSRFLNVIGLFNGFIPLIALQLTALKVGDQLVLSFAKIVDEMVLGDEDEALPEAAADRAYWVQKGSEESVALADACLAVLREITPELDLKYCKHYIGLSENGLVNNFVRFRAKKHFLRVEIRIADLEGWSAKLDEAGIEILEGGRRLGRLCFRLAAEDIEACRDLLREVFATSRSESD